MGRNTSFSDMHNSTGHLFKPLDVRHENILSSLVTESPLIPLEHGIKIRNKYSRMWSAIINS